MRLVWPNREELISRPFAGLYKIRLLLRDRMRTKNLRFILAFLQLHRQKEFIKKNLKCCYCFAARSKEHLKLNTVLNSYFSTILENISFWALNAIWKLVLSYEKTRFPRDIAKTQNSHQNKPIITICNCDQSFCQGLKF